MSVKDKLISNSMYLLMHWGMDTVLYMLFWILLAKTLTTESYGTVALGMQVITLLSNVSLLGLDLTVSRLLPEWSKGEQGDEKAISLAWLSVKAVFITSAMLSLGFWGFSFVFPSVLKLSAAYVPIIAVSIVVAALVLVFESIYFGRQDMKRIFWTRILGDIGLVGLGFGSALYMSDPIGPLSAILISSLAIFSLRASRSFLFPKDVIRLDIKPLFEYAFPAFLVVLLSAITTNTQFIVLTAFENPGVTGVFAVAMKITIVLSVVPAIFARALFPTVSELSSSSDMKKKQAYLMSLVFRYGTFVGVLATSMVILFGRQLVLFFSGPEYMDAVLVLPSLAIGAMLLGLATQLVLGLFGIGEPKKYRDSYLLATIAYLISAPTLTYLFSFMGMAVAYLASNIILFITSLVYVRRSLRFTVRSKDLMKVAFALCISVTLLSFSIGFVKSFSLQAVMALAAGVVYVAILLLSGFFVKEDLKVLDFVSGTPFLRPINPAIKYVRRILDRFVKEDYFLATCGND
jgi:O-antigen/teichoic acid export membrane protein